MKQVWKCDYCPDTHQDKTVIESHEPSCSFNPKNKKCYTCKYEFEAGYPIGGHQTGCKLNLNTTNGEEKGNCAGWEKEDD